MKSYCEVTFDRDSFSGTHMSKITVTKSTKMLLYVFFFTVLGSCWFLHLLVTKLNILYNRFTHFNFCVKMYNCRYSMEHFQNKMLKKLLD